MEKVKIKDIKTGAVKEVKKSLADDFVGTGNFILVTEEDKKYKYEEPTSFSSKKNK